MKQFKNKVYKVYFWQKIEKKTHEKLKPVNRKMREVFDSRLPCIMN